MNVRKTSDKLASDWWERWWAEDYSWDGLSKKIWSGWVVDEADGSIHDGDKVMLGAKVRRATLQDYWRDQADNLIRSPVGNKYFTRVHLPLNWQDGSPTGKASWQDDVLDLLLEPKLRLGEETNLHSPADFLGIDHRAQLCGAILLRSCSHPDGRQAILHLNAKHACFVRESNFANHLFGQETGFEAARFEHSALFAGSRFDGEVNFSNGSFLGPSTFDGARFEGLAQFRNGQFENGAFFSKAHFASEVGFQSAHFKRAVHFDSAFFGEDALFDGATFEGVVEFDFSIFVGEAWFSEAKFQQDAWFGGACFKSDAFFGSATFGKMAFFVARTKESNQVPVTFYESAIFKNAIFESSAQFESAQFNGRMNFDSSVFKRFADFSKVCLSKKESDWRGGFDGAWFESVLDARGVSMVAVSLFSGARFDRGVMLERSDEMTMRGAHRAALKEATHASDFNEALSALESGALKLKQAMEAEKDYSREQCFHRLELRTRRRRAGTAWTEKAFSSAYGCFAGYGASIGIPITWLLVTVLGFAIMFWSLDRGLGTFRAHTAESQKAVIVAADFVEAMRFSLSRVFPLGTWNDSDESVRIVQEKEILPIVSQDDCSFRERLAAVGPCRPIGAKFETRTRLELHRILIAILSTLETILAGGLYFLFGLAVRRKFQIS